VANETEQRLSNVRIVITFFSKVGLELSRRTPLPAMTEWSPCDVDARVRADIKVE
jgi:hypothetical protein